MTDRQITESSIGLAGRLSHLPYRLGKAEDCGWQSTRNFAQNIPVFRELGPHKTWSPSAGAIRVQPPGSSATTASQTSRRQQKWLLKVHPEARLGNECMHDELLSHSSQQPHLEEPWGSPLFVIGELTDTSEPRRVSGAPLVAIAAGEANDVLCLAKPSVEEWQWGEDNSASLVLASMENAETVLWEDEAGGPIRRLKSVVDSKRYDPTRWVILQKDSGTRVFQPQYRRAMMASGYNGAGMPSRIAVNPLLFLPKDQTGGSPHSDVAFNPGTRANPPQLGLIDECGFWSIWDIAHTRVKSSGKPKACLSKCGHIEKGLLDQPPFKGTGETQWHKILWVACPGDPLERLQTFDFEEDGDVPEIQDSFPQLVRSSTLLLCSPKSARLLDLSRNLFLPSLSFVREGGQDRILDVHENPPETQYVFILTTLKLFMVRVFSAPGQKWDEAQKQWAIVLSVPHFRDGFGQSLKLAAAPGARSSEQAISQVYIYSTSSTWIDLFCVATSRSDPSKITYHREAVVLDAFQRISPEAALQTLSLHPLSVAIKAPGSLSQSARSLAKREVQFYQLAALRRDMCLVSTLCVSSPVLPIEQISRPDHQVSRVVYQSRERRKVLKYLSSRFIVPDDAALHGVEAEPGQSLVKAGAVPPSQLPVIERPIRLFYEYLCAVIGDQAHEYYRRPDGEETLSSNPFDHIQIAVEQANENGYMRATTLFQMVENLRLTSDMSVTSAEWEAEVERLRQINPSVILLSLNRPHSWFTKPSDSLKELYLMLTNIMGSVDFGDEAQTWIQGTRTAVLRQMAYDIYLSIYGLVRRPLGLDESQQPPSPIPETHSPGSMLIDSQQEGPRRKSSRSQSKASTIDSRGSQTGSSPGEDPAMTLLRSYTGTGKFVPVKRTMLLDKWEVGADPGNYMFDLDRNKEETPGMQRRAKQLARESRKRRRAETLLQIQGDKEPNLTSTQPAPDTRFFSQYTQPAVGYSQSQPIMSDPIHTMSQPTSGIFGRRDERPKKKIKKRKGGF
ncbi:hypothetical protein AAE478_005449 [Parahypoxylon ruwenzoriense]